MCFWLLGCECLVCALFVAGGLDGHFGCFQFEVWLLLLFCLGEFSFLGLGVIGDKCLCFFYAADCV